MSKNNPYTTHAPMQAQLQAQVPTQVQAQSQPQPQLIYQADPAIMQNMQALKKR